MQKPTLQEIHDSIIKHGFKVFTQPFSVNLGGIRTNDNTANTFNDWLYAFYFDSSGNIKGIVIPGTTDAGVYYREKPMNKNGTAIIQHNVQQKGVYQLQDPTKNKKQLGHNGQKAFRQIKPMAYWRDNDKDRVLEFDGKSFVEIGYTNGHYMGTVGKLVNNWSAGCWGGTVKNMNDLFAIAEIQINNGLGDIYSFTLLHEMTF